MCLPEAVDVALFSGFKLDVVKYFRSQTEAVDRKVTDRGQIFRVETVVTLSVR